MKRFNVFNDYHAVMPGSDDKKFRRICLTLALIFFSMVSCTSSQALSSKSPTGFASGLPSDVNSGIRLVVEDHTGIDRVAEPVTSGAGWMMITSVNYRMVFLARGISINKNNLYGEAGSVL